MLIRMMHATSFSSSERSCLYILVQVFFQLLAGRLNRHTDKPNFRVWVDQEEFLRQVGVTERFIARPKPMGLDDWGNILFLHTSPLIWDFSKFHPQDYEKSCMRRGTAQI